MADPTTSELMRIVTQMAEDSKEHRAELKATIAGLASDIKELKETTGEIKIQTTKTNGNVIGLKSDVYGGEGKDGLVKTVGDLKSRERYVAGAVGVVLAIFAVVPFFLKLYLKDAMDQYYKENGSKIVQELKVEMNKDIKNDLQINK